MSASGNASISKQTGWLAALKQRFSALRPRAATGDAAQPAAEDCGLPPQTGRLLLLQNDFESIFAGITGTSNEKTVFGRGKKGFQPDGCCERVTQNLQNPVTRIRTLNSYHRQIETGLQGNIEGICLTVYPGKVLIPCGGVEHHAEPVLSPIVDNEIVDDAALLIEHAGVHRLAGSRCRSYIVGKQKTHELPYLRSIQIHNHHVRDIEHSRRAPHLMVLFDLGAVVKRHLPTTEIHHFATQGDMFFIQYCLQGHDLCSSSA